MVSLDLKKALRIREREGCSGRKTLCVVIHIHIYTHKTYIYIQFYSEKCLGKKSVFISDIKQRLGFNLRGK